MNYLDNGHASDRTIRVLLRCTVNCVIRSDNHGHVHVTHERVDV